MNQPASSNNPFYKRRAAQTYNQLILAHPVIRILRRQEETRLKQLFGRYLRSTDRVIEVGAGTGYYTLAIAEKVNQVVALEPAPPMAAWLRNKIASAKQKNILLVEKNFFDYQTSEKYDWLIAIGVLDYIENWRFFLERALKLAPNLIFTVPQKGIWSGIFKFCSALGGTKIYPRRRQELENYFRHWRRVEIEEVGFRSPITKGHTLIVLARQEDPVKSLRDQRTSAV